MKVFLSSVEGSECYGLRRSYPNLRMNWNLISFFYLKQSQEGHEHWNWLGRQSKQLLVDSGAHSFQKGVIPKGGWAGYTQRYVDWIAENDRSNVLGYFEMDIDNVVPYADVLRMRRTLERISDKIIPVWHRNRGVKDYVQMCKDYSGGIVAITGIGNTDIHPSQYHMFVEVAWKHDCRIHCLGMTRKEILDTIPFDYVDSSSWKQTAIRKNINRAIRQPAGMHYRTTLALAYLDAMKMQEHYYSKWALLGRD